MEYVPRKKWQVKGTGRTDPAPGLFVPKLGGNSSQHSPRSIYDRNYDKHRIQSGKIVYGNKATSMWFAVGLKTDYKIPSSISLKPVSSPLIEWRGPEEHFILVNSEVKKRTDKHEEPLLKSPWVCIAENVLEEIQSSFHKLKNEVGCPNLDEQHLALVARFGKLVFHRYPSANFRNNSVSETSLRKLKRSFCTNIPPSYAENLIGAVQELGLEVDATEEMESYRVKFSDSEKPDATITCECRVAADGERLDLYKENRIEPPSSPGRGRLVLWQEFRCEADAADQKNRQCSKRR
uniref:DUF7903 domain-containing protein n=1 Tax=Kalanchoe fedtschenkoi TaxID=63787 RepID=A0A7N0VI12_KALFE